MAKRESLKETRVVKIGEGTTIATDTTGGASCVDR